MAKKMTIYVQDDVYLKLKGMSIDAGKSMSAILGEFIEAAPSPDGKWYKEWLREQKSKEAGK